MTRETLESPSFNLPPSRKLVFPGGRESLAEERLGAGKLVINEQAIAENEAERLHQQEIARKVGQLKAGTEVKLPYLDLTPSPADIPSYIPTKTIEALAFAIAGGQGRDTLPPVQAEALKPPEQTKELKLSQAFPVGSEEKEHWEKVTGDIRGTQEVPPKEPPVEPGGPTPLAKKISLPEAAGEARLYPPLPDSIKNWVLEKATELDKRFYLMDLAKALFVPGMIEAQFTSAMDALVEAVGGVDKIHSAGRDLHAEKVTGAERIIFLNNTGMNIRIDWDSFASLDWERVCGGKKIIVLVVPETGEVLPALHRALGGEGGIAGFFSHSFGGTEIVAVSVNEPWMKSMTLEERGYSASKTLLHELLFHGHQTREMRLRDDHTGVEKVESRVDITGSFVSLGN